MKTTIPFSIVLVFLSVTLAPQARATCQEGCDTTNGSTFLGDGALENNTNIDNTATGAGALSSNTIGNYNTANGFSALSNNTAGYKNTALGWEGLLNNSTGAFNVAVGYRAGTGIVHANNVIAIGAA